MIIMDQQVPGGKYCSLFRRLDYNSFPLDLWKTLCSYSSQSSEQLEGEIEWAETGEL